MTDLSPEARRLHVLLTRTGFDGQLDLLALLGGGPESILGLPLTLIVDGVLMKGTLAAGDRFAEAADRTLASIIRTAPISSDGTAKDPESLREGLAAGFEDPGVLRILAQSAMDQQREARQKVDAYKRESGLPHAPAIDEAPASIFADLAETSSPSQVLTLSAAAVFMPMLGWQDVGFLRVITSHVGAWWIAEPPSVAVGNLNI